MPCVWSLRKFPGGNNWFSIGVKIVPLFCHSHRNELTVTFSWHVKGSLAGRRLEIQHHDKSSFPLEAAFVCFIGIITDEQSRLRRSSFVLGYPPS